MRSWLLLIGLGGCFLLLGCGNTVGPYTMCENSGDCAKNQRCVGQICASMIIHPVERSVSGEGTAHTGKEPSPTQRKEVNPPEKPTHQESPSEGRDASAPKEAAPQEALLTDGKDNKCDGGTDEGCPCNYKGLRYGVCRDSTRDSNGQCKQPAQYQLKDICDDGLDNNCDGAVDEGCACNYLGNSVGVCRVAFRDTNGQCQPPQGYGDEVCGDNKDNNCNGYTDRFPSTDRCLTTQTCRFSRDRYTVCGAGIPYCKGSQLSCYTTLSVNPCREAQKCQKDTDCQSCPGGSSKYDCKSGYCVRK